MNSVLGQKKKLKRIGVKRYEFSKGMLIFRFKRSIRMDSLEGQFFSSRERSGPKILSHCYRGFIIELCMG